MKTYIISFTENGDKLNLKLTQQLKNYEVVSFPNGTRKENLSEWTKSAFDECKLIIFIGAVGIAVRAIAPYIKSKAEDPAVIVIDEKGSFVIPVLSGHIGRANELAKEISTLIGGTPVITTATDINNVWAVDSWAVNQGFKINNIKNIKYISQACLKNEKIGFISHINIDKQQLPENIEIDCHITENGVVVSPFLHKPYKNTLNIVPKCGVLGVGSRKNADETALIQLFEKLASDNKIDKGSVKAVATVDIKKDEASVVKLCQYLGVQLICFSAEELNSVKGEFTASDFVKNAVGTDNVCERSAVLASDNGELVIKKTALNGVTMAMAITKECN